MHLFVMPTKIILSWFLMTKTPDLPLNSFISQILLPSLMIKGSINFNELNFGSEGEPFCLDLFIGVDFNVDLLVLPSFYG